MREDLYVTYKRVNGIYHSNALNEKRRQQCNKLVAEWLPLFFTDALNLVRLMKFIMDALVSCRRINYLTSVNDYTDASRTITAALRISGVQVTYILDSIVLLRSYPATTRTVQRSAFTCKTLKT